MFKTALYHLPSCHIWIPRSFVCFFFIHSNYEIGIFRIISPGLLSSTCRHLKAGNTIVSSLPKSWLLFSSCVRCCLLGKMIDPEGERREDSFWFSDCVVRARVSSLWRRSIICVLVSSSCCLLRYSSIGLQIEFRLPRLCSFELQNPISEQRKTLLFRYIPKIRHLFRPCIGCDFYSGNNWAAHSLNQQR